MTDDEIIKSMWCCDGWDGRCLNCPLNREGTNCKEKLNSYALDLINRQKAEIEQWKEEANRYQNLWCIAVDDIEKSKSEAIKEFARELKCGVPQETGVIRCADVDDLVKKMTEVNKK